MKLLTVGDSFTYGEELADRNMAWPQQLASKLGYELINLGQPSASNDNILRKTLDHLTFDTADLVVIGWSNIGRSEYADEFGYYDVWPGYQGNLFIRDGCTWRSELVDYISRYHNVEAIHRKFIQQVILLQSYFKSCGIRYVMLNIVQNEYYKKRLFEGHQKYFDQVDTDYFLGFNKSGMMEWTYGCAQGPGGHFLEQGHQIVAERINEHIGNLGWLS
jgi:Family of unknown function (DUF6071)